MVFLRVMPCLPKLWYWDWGLGQSFPLLMGDVNTHQKDWLAIEQSSTLNQHKTHNVSKSITTLYSVLLLESSPGVTEVSIIEKLPAERHMISSWEQVSVCVWNFHLPTQKS